MWQLFSRETLEGDFADFHAARCEGLCFDAIEKQRQLARGGAGSKDFAFDEISPLPLTSILTGAKSKTRVGVVGTPGRVPGCES
jgi:hypothetical protein